MIPFDWDDFLAPLSPYVLLMSFLLGLAVGFFQPADVHARTRRFYWMLGNGLVFYVPLSMLRAFEGSPIWERFLATFVLWLIFTGGVYLGSWRRHDTR